MIFGRLYVTYSIKEPKLLPLANMSRFATSFSGSEDGPGDEVGVLIKWCCQEPLNYHLSNLKDITLSVDFDIFKKISRSQSITASPSLPSYKHPSSNLCFLLKIAFSISVCDVIISDNAFFSGGKQTMGALWSLINSMTEWIYLMNVFFFEVFQIFAFC